MKLTYRIFFISIIFFSIPSFGDYWLRSDNARDQEKMEEGQLCYVVDTDAGDIFFGTVNSDKHCAGKWYDKRGKSQSVAFEEGFSFQLRDRDELKNLKSKISEEDVDDINELIFLKVSDEVYLKRNYQKVWGEMQAKGRPNYELKIKRDGQDRDLEVRQVVRTQSHNEWEDEEIDYKLVASVKYDQQVEKDEPEEDTSMDLGDRRVIEGYIFLKVKSAWVKRGPNYEKVDLKSGIMDPFSGSVTNLGGLLGSGTEEKFFKEFIRQHKNKGITKGAFDHRGKGAFGDEHDFSDTARGKNKAWRISKKKI